MGDPAVWQRAQDAAREALRASGIPFVEAPGEAAFYGPKLDVQIKDAIGREFTLSTNQIDFLMPERFGLEYVTSEQSMARPVMIHRAPIGSMERFMAYLIETYAGAFPVWLAPVQLTFIPIADRHFEAVGRLAERFRQRDLRVEVDGRSERMQAKIRDAQLQKVPTWLWSATKSSRRAPSISDGERAATRSRSGRTSSWRGSSAKRSFRWSDILARAKRGCPNSHLQAGAEEVKRTKIASGLFFIFEGGLIHGI